MYICIYIWYVEPQNAEPLIKYIVMENIRLWEYSGCFQETFSENQWDTQGQFPNFTGVCDVKKISGSLL